MDSLYIVFDQLPSHDNGGLVATYVNLIEEFEGELDVHLVSIFGHEPTDIDLLSELPTETVIPVKIDLRFPHALDHLKKRRFRDLARALGSAFVFFGAIPFARLRTRSSLHGKAVVASSPAAAIFLSKKVDYILEIHTAFEYFWGTSILGRLQSVLMPSSRLVLFRTRTDAAKAASKMDAGFIYNCFPDPPRSNVVACDQDRACKALFVGRLTKEKDPLRLIELAKRMVRLLPGFELDVYGTGELYEDMRSVIERNGLQEVVHLRGYTTDKHIYRRYKALWMTSQCEGLSLVLIEALANGTPVVATRWGDAASEAIIDGETGYIVEDDEAFVARSYGLVTDERTFERMSKAARSDYEERFTRAANKEAWCQVLRSEFDIDVE